MNRAEVEMLIFQSTKYIDFFLILQQFRTFQDNWIGTWRVTRNTPFSVSFQATMIIALYPYEPWIYICISRPRIRPSHSSHLDGW